MTDNLITLPDDVIDPIKESMEAGGGVQLPFDVCYFWVVNGDARMSQMGGVSYFGGWNGSRDAIDEFVASTQNVVPASFKAVDRTYEDGKTSTNYETRHLIVAPIAFRQSWMTDDNLRHDHYVNGGRQHAQYLAYMMVKEGENYAPWGPVVLSGKGYQARNITDAFSAWEHATKDARRAIAPNVPSYFFALAIGTFGQTPDFKEVGGKAKAKITPIKPYMPEQITPELMRKLFVGESVAAIMADLRNQAVDWLNAWKGEGVDTLTKSNNDNGNAPSNFVDNPNDDIPF